MESFTLKVADLAKARSEVDPRVEALRAMHWLSRHLYGFILLSEQLEGAVELSGFLQRDSKEAEAAEAKLADLKAAIATAEVEETRQAAAFLQTRRAREDALEALEKKAAGLAGAGARIDRLNAQEESIAQQRARLTELSNDIDRRQESLAILHREVLQGTNLAEQRSRLQEMGADLESREARVAEMHKQIHQMMKERTNDEEPIPAAGGE